MSRNNSEKSLKKSIIWQKGCSFVFALLAVVLIARFNCAAQEAGSDVVIKVMRGSVKEINAEKSMLVFRATEGDIELLVPKKARIFP